jgi:hypothetical protein
VYFLTLIDRKQARTPHAVDEDGYPDNGLDPFALRSIRSSYVRLLGLDLNYVGMIEPAYYAYTQKVFRTPTVLLYHAHCLVWGVSQRKLDAICERIRGKIKPMLPYATGAQYERVNDGHLLRVLGYICKTPCKQYQLSPRKSGKGFNQWKWDINGVNSVRLYSEMHDTTLDQLAIAGGAGVEFLDQLDRDIQRWQRNARTKGYIQ